jgi:hypothetical protein
MEVSKSDAHSMIRMRAIDRRQPPTATDQSLSTRRMHLALHGCPAFHTLRCASDESQPSRCPPPKTEKADKDLRSDFNACHRADRNLLPHLPASN